MFERKKKSNEWDYVKEQKEEQEKGKEYIVSSEKKFRARALIITAVLCVAVVALGILYMHKIIETSNAETVDNSAAVDTSSKEAENPAGNTEAASAQTTTAEKDAATAATAEQTTTAATEQTTAQTEPAEDFTAAAFADENGLSLEWSYTNNDYDGQKLSVFMTDGVTSYLMIGDQIPVTAKRFTSSADNTKNAVGLMIIMTDTNGGNTFDKTITVDNRTYQPEVTYSDDIDISSLFN